MFHGANLSINPEITKHFGIYFCILYHFFQNIKSIRYELSWASLNK